LHSAVCALEAKRTDIPTVSEIFLLIMRSLLVCLQQEKKRDHVVSIVGILHMCLETMGDLAHECMDQKELEVVGITLIRLLQESYENIRALNEYGKNADFDAEEKDKLQKENEEEDELHAKVAQLASLLIRSYGEAFLPVFNNVFPSILQMLDPSMTDGTKQVAAETFSDVIEVYGINAAPFFPHFVPAFIHYLRPDVDSHPALKQLCAYGLSLLATYGKNSFEPFLEGSVNVLLQGATRTDAKTAELAAATDNMIVAIGSVALYHNRPDLWQTWLYLLPLTADKSEGQKTYSQLCDLVENNEPGLLGSDSANLPKITSVLLKVVRQGEEEWLGNDPELAVFLRRRIYHLRKKTASSGSLPSHSYSP